jgi:hypothetical protein
MQVGLQPVLLGVIALGATEGRRRAQGAVAAGVAERVLHPVPPGRAPPARSPGVRDQADGRRAASRAGLWLRR